MLWSVGSTSLLLMRIDFLPTFFTSHAHACTYLLYDMSHVQEYQNHHHRTVVAESSVKTVKQGPPVRDVRVQLPGLERVFYSKPSDR
jgi:hypothetical protein